MSTKPKCNSSLLNQWSFNDDIQIIYVQNIHNSSCSETSGKLLQEFVGMIHEYVKETFKIYNGLCHLYT